MCIFVYLQADRPLEEVGHATLHLKKLKPRDHKRLIDGEHVYLALGGCACALTLDGAEEADKAERETLLDAFEALSLDRCEVGSGQRPHH